MKFLIALAAAFSISAAAHASTVSCINMRGIRSVKQITETVIKFEGRNQTYLAQTSRCPIAKWGPLVYETFGGRLCRGDVIYAEGFPCHIRSFQKDNLAAPTVH